MKKMVFVIADDGSISDFWEAPQSEIDGDEFTEWMKELEDMGFSVVLRDLHDL